MALLHRALRSVAQWPAPVLNGISVGVGLACLTALVGSVAGMPAAITAASGASATSVADTVCAPSVKRQQMVPAVLSSILVTALVAFSHTSPLWLTAVVLSTIFTSIFWMSWGKRGGPQTFVMVLTLVFQMAAFTRQNFDAAQMWRHIGWVALGAVGAAVWAELSIRLLARRYRTLALSESLDALADMMLAQAHWTQAHRPGDTASQKDALLTLVRRQAGIADIFQSARDLLYSQADETAVSALTRQQTQALIHTINLRDVVQSCQLDVDRLPAHDQAQKALQTVSTVLQAHATRLQEMADAWRRARRVDWPALPHADRPAATDPVLHSLGRRLDHSRALVESIGWASQAARPSPDQQARGDTQRDAIGGTTETAAVLRTLVSPSEWTWPPLRAQFNVHSSVFRYAVRATLAVGCADAIAHVLPWTSHPHWILMTVAVVMRGNLEQTLARRDARVQGTLVGCLIASALLTMAGHSAWLLAALVVALSLAHGFVLINYRVTAAAGAVLALVQGHLFSPSQHPALVDAAERLGDTLIGAALAWAFSYVLPSWEKAQLPKLAQRLLRAQQHYAHQALRWHTVHERSATRSLARREVYDVLWLLSQSLQRIDKEPRHTRQWAQPLEMLLLHSNRLVSHLAAIKGLLTVRHGEMDASKVEPALRAAEAEIRRCLDGPLHERDIRPEPTRIADQTLGGATETDLPGLNDPYDLEGWLAVRLSQAVREAALLADAAWLLRQPP